MRTPMQDDAFHEIQLNGKQLVFLFMAATVVAVVIFLCGVMVGRGVPQRAGDITEVPIEAASIDPTVLPPAATSSSSSTAAAPSAFRQRASALRDARYTSASHRR